MRWSGQAARFDFVDLRLFANVSECESLSRGAEHSNISLAAASTRIKNLELNLGLKLFNRCSRGVTLTPAGETLFAHVRKLLRQMDELHADLGQFLNGGRRQIRLASNLTGLAGLLPCAMRSFLASFPDIDVELLYYRSRDGLRALTDGDVDLALVSFSVREPSVAAIPVGKTRSVLIARSDHPLARQPSIRFAELLDHDLVGLGEARSTQYARLAKQMKRTLSYRIHVTEYEELCRFVADGIGVAVVPDSIAAKHAPRLGLRVVDIDERWASRELNICLRRDVETPDHTRALVELIQEVAAADMAQPPAPERPRSRLRPQMAAPAVS